MLSVNYFFSYLSESVYSLVKAFAGISLASSGLPVLMIFSKHSIYGMRSIMVSPSRSCDRLDDDHMVESKKKFPAVMLSCYYTQTRHFGDKDGIH